jgi:hypothetical protein
MMLCPGRNMVTKEGMMADAEDCGSFHTTTVVSRRLPPWRRCSLLVRPVHMEWIGERSPVDLGESVPDFPKVY